MCVEVKAVEPVTRAPDTVRIKPLSLDQLDRPATPILNKINATPVDAAKSPGQGYNSPLNTTPGGAPPVDNYLLSRPDPSQPQYIPDMGEATLRRMPRSDALT